MEGFDVLRFEVETVTRSADEQLAELIDGGWTEGTLTIGEYAFRVSVSRLS